MECLFILDKISDLDLCLHCSTSSVCPARTVCGVDNKEIFTLLIITLEHLNVEHIIFLSKIL